jgi:hypothetical protein
MSGSPGDLSSTWEPKESDMKSRVWRVALWLVGALLLPAAAFAQASITGTVRDSSGAVLPGVTVEAASPALIEKVRSAVTDGAGQYRIIDLRPGTYTITFALTGFNTVRRDGIALAGSFTATVNAEMRVGALEETITVTGESPVVDVQSVRQQQVLDRDVIDAIPSGRTHFAIAELIPGVNTTNSSDVGGSNAVALVQMTAHGSRTTDARVAIDGMSTQNAEGAGHHSGYLPNITGTQEISVDIAAGTAEQATGGVSMNIIPRDGGNLFSGTYYMSGMNSRFQGNNLSDALRARGLSSSNDILNVYDINPGMGGPIVRDRLWFFSAARWNGNANYVGGVYWNKHAGNPDVWIYEPDLSRPATYHAWQRSFNTRLTWQMHEKHKISGFVDYSHRCQCPRPNINVTPEAADSIRYPYKPLATLTWTSPMTNRVLLEAGYSYRPERWLYPLPPAGDPRRSMIAVVEQSTGLRYRGGHPNALQPYQDTQAIVNGYRAAVSYVTGSHAFKFGVNDTHSSRTANVFDDDTNVWYRFNNGVPNQITQKATPYLRKENIKADLGIYVQDKWTINRLTLNLGARYDYLNIYFPDQHLGPTRFTPARDVTFERTPWTAWHDVTPRLGAAYDLFGNGKTAVKVTLNKYTLAIGLQGPFSNESNPINRTAISVTRSWSDADRDFSPDCDLVNPLQNGECGQVSNLGFGQPGLLTTTVDPDILSGWGTRGYNWEFSTGVQHELMPQVSVNVGYFRRWYGNFTLSDNLAVGPEDFGEFSITAPSDPRLPQGGGYQIAGLMNVNPDRFGRVDNYFTSADSYGTQVEYWHGLDLSANTRLGRGILIQGGLSSGRTVTDNCEILRALPEISPVGLPYCHSTEKFLTQIKGFAAYTIPWVELQVSATLQSLPGPEIAANFNAPSATVAPSLGRPLSGNAANVTVNLVEPGTMYGERANQLDLRFGKTLRFGGTRAVLSVDLYNALNADAVITQNNSYAAWQRPQAILQARFAKFGVQVDF